MTKPPHTAQVVNFDDDRIGFLKFGLMADLVVLQGQMSRSSEDGSLRIKTALAAGGGQTAYGVL